MTAKVEGDNGNKTVFYSRDFLGMTANKTVTDTAKKTLENYSLGSCGPRGFYGTTRKHLELEESLAKFMGTPESITYSDEITTTASAVPAFAKRGDVLLLDSGVSYAVQTGAKLSRSKLLYFQHNDMSDLRRYLEAQKHADKKDNFKLAKTQRRFIVVEGLYTNYGDICKLDEVVSLAREFKWRVFLDDTNGFGVLGKTGRGAVEHFNMQPLDVDVLIGSLSGTLGSVGGFCVGSREVVDHQRLSGAGYCFSASAPPFLCASAEAALNTMRENPALLAQLKSNANKLQTLLENKVKQMKLVASADSPMKHLQLCIGTSNTKSGAVNSTTTGPVILSPSAPSLPTREVLLSRAEEENILASVVRKVAAAGFLIARSHYLPTETQVPRPSIKVCVTSAHKDAELEKLVSAISAAVTQVLDELPTDIYNRISKFTATAGDVAAAVPEVIMNSAPKSTTSRRK